MSDRINPRYRRRGFTLVELLVVVAIVAILAAVAVPSYSNYVAGVRRGDAQAALVAFAAAMERFHIQNGTYVGTSSSIPGAPIAAVFASQVPLDGGTAYYTLAVSAADIRSFTLTATPVASGPQANDGILRLLSNGERGWQKKGSTDWIPWTK